MTHIAQTAEGQSADEYIQATKLSNPQKRICSVA
jgi:hypothetical protein